MTSFVPSPVLLPQKLAHAILSGDDGDEKSKKWLAEHKNIRVYLAMVARASADAGIDPAFQGAILAQENGGFERWSTDAHSSADANGIAQFIPSTWKGAWNPYRNKSPNEPQYAIKAQAIFLRMLLKNNNGSMTRAAGEYYGAQDPKYTGGVQNYYNELTEHHVFSKAGKSILSGVGDAAKGILDDAGGIIGGAKDAADVASRIADVLLHPSKLGELLADTFAAWLKFVARAVWRYVLAPPFHWAQRATVYYFDNIMGSKDGENKGYLYNYAGMATIAFWGVGYGILWRNADSPKEKAYTPEDTSLGKLISGVSSTVARRKVAAPDKVKQATPTKPKPVQSSVSVAHVKSLSATRKRSVNVQQVGTEGTSDVRPDGTADRTRAGEGGSGREGEGEGRAAPPPDGSQEAPEGD
jgi:hypothetical protein